MDIITHSAEKEEETIPKRKVCDEANEEVQKLSKKCKLADDNNSNKSQEPAQAAEKLKNKELQKIGNKTAGGVEEASLHCSTQYTGSKDWNFKIATWNVAGIRAVLKKGGIEYLRKENADIVVLQETKCNTFQIPFEVKLQGYKHYFLDNIKKPGQCGVALYSKVKPIQVKFGFKGYSRDEGRAITAEYDQFYIVNVYVPNSGTKLISLPKRLEWNKHFKQYITELDKKKPVIIVGDMNVAHKDIDIKFPEANIKNPGFTKEERDDMTDFLAAGFIDTFRMLYPEKSGAFTYWSYFNNAREKNIGWRLDYCLVSERIKNKVCDIINRDKVYGSDHCPVVCYLKI